MALDMVAVTGGKPKAMRVGNVISVPDPTTVLIVPAPTPARKMAMISTVLTPAPYGGPDPGPARVSRFVGCSPLCSPTRSAVRAFRARFIALSELARERGPARSWRQSGQWVRDCSKHPGDRITRFGLPTHRHWLLLRHRPGSDRHRPAR